MAMFTGDFEVSVSVNVENWREKFIILISILYPIYSVLIRSPNLKVSSKKILSKSKRFSKNLTKEKWFELLQPHSDISDIDNFLTDPETETGMQEGLESQHGHSGIAMPEHIEARALKLKT